MIYLKKYIFSLLLAVLLTAGMGHPEAGETYRWVNKKGTIHVSEHPPEKKDRATAIVIEKEYNSIKSIDHLTKETVVNRKLTPLQYAALSTFTVQASHTIGTGFFISPNGYAITCRHVIEEEGNHTAILHNQKKYPIGIISKSDEYDLALILVTQQERTPYLLLKNPVEIDDGDRIYAVGISAEYKSIITDGIFTGLRKHDTAGKRIVLFSAPVNPGNSGGPLVSIDGKVIGAISSELLSNNGIPVSGVGFAVPSDYILEEYGKYVSSR